MATAPNGLAMRVENKRTHIGQAGFRDGRGKMRLQPFDCQHRRNLPHKATGIGKAGLHGNHAAPFDVGAIGRLLKHLRDHAATISESVRGFK